MKGLGFLHYNKIIIIERYLYRIWHIYKYLHTHLNLFMHSKYELRNSADTITKFTAVFWVCLLYDDSQNKIITFIPK